ncbi:F-box protein At-B [Salvia miltiorrhiza]|uniref:F-box protein At-B n=1 Tax=Salvia miltiorrhiza TaxID=226208 RepID=UPI0025AB8D39|nr:F-box protein At-B [Salvia miltiorrhiza]
MFRKIIGDMKNCSKRPREKTAAKAAEDIGGAPPPRDGFLLPNTIVLSEILTRLELDALCTVACVSRTLRSLVSQSLMTLPSLDLSAFSPNGELVSCIAPRLGAVKSVTIDCLKVYECSIVSILGPHLLELNLLKCPWLSYHVLPSIGEKCPNLRNLVLELAGKNAPEIFRKSFVKMLQNLLYLEHLSIKVRGTESDAYSLTYVDLFLPKTLKSLKLQLVNERDAGLLIEKLGDDRESSRKMVNPSTSITSYQGFSGFTLTCLSLVLDAISDRLVASITSSLRLLVELDLEDRQCSEAKVLHDLTNSGLLLLGSLRYLTHLSIVRSRANYPASFKRVNDVGILVLAESCRGLESVRLGGFSKVTDAGFSSLVHSCHNLKKLEILNAPLLSDLAFHDMIGAVSPLVELKLASCNLITSEAVAELASSSTLEVLDTYSCRSIADPCLDYVSRLSKLTSINLGGADITDSGLGALSKGDLPITNLCLRGCTRVTDRGIIRLLNDGIRIKKKLSSLDISNMPGVSDRAIHAVISCTDALTELRMRSCFHVTNESFQILASGKSGGRNFLRKLDISHCIGFSDGLVELLQQGHSFLGLRWLGVAGTYLVKCSDFAAICGMQPCLTVCFEGCEVGCHDGWQYHI